MWKCSFCKDGRLSKDSVERHEKICEFNPVNADIEFLVVGHDREIDHSYYLENKDGKIKFQGLLSREVAKKFAKSNGYIALDFYHDESPSKKMCRLLGFKDVESYAAYNKQLLRNDVK